jgi:uncharacterized protein (TIGR03435 family)
VKKLLAVVMLAALHAQEFEVVSVKPANPELSQGGVAHLVRPGNGQWEWRNIYLSDLIRSAYHINENQLAGGPNWLGTAGWDIDAKIPASAPPAQVPSMLQAMLADRFHLKVHWESRTMPVYMLTVAKSGPKLKESSNPAGGFSAGPRMIKYSAGSMQDLAGQLTSYLGKQVLDRTELTGRYTIDLQFAPVDPGSQDAAETRPSIFQALQEQLGLRLDSGRGPVQVLVIDKAEKPSEN